MPNSTLKTILQDRIWEQAQNRDSSYIAAQEASRQAVRVFALSLEAVTARYAFAPAHDLFRFTAAGDCTQAAMTLTEGTDSLTVIAKVEEDATVTWFIQDASRLHFDAAVYVQAVKNRLEANRRAN